MYRSTYEGDHWQVPGGGQSRFGGTRVFWADERHGAVGVELRHCPQRFESIGLVVVRPVLELAGARSAEQFVVGTPQRVVDGADEVLAVASVQRQYGQEADEIWAPGRGGRRRRRRDGQ